jgi:phage N-6-adenine-methyltransferase
VTDFTLSHLSDDHWSTPPCLYEALNTEFNFMDDPCPLHGEGKENGLKREWGERVFMNPPYSNIEPWVHKAYTESLKGKLIVGLLRGDTSTRWFHEWVLGKAEIRFIRGRVKFGKRLKPAPFPSIIAIWDGRKREDKND